MRPSSRVAPITRPGSGDSELAAWELQHSRLGLEQREFRGRGHGRRKAARPQGPRAETIQEVARTAPLDRILVETDAPFLAPPPHRGKRNEPAFVVEVARKVAALRGVTLEVMGAASAANFRTMFSTRS